MSGRWGWRWDRNAHGWVRTYPDHERCEAIPHDRKRCSRRAQLSHLGRAVCWQHGRLDELQFVDPETVQP